MSQEKLDNLMLLYCERDIVDIIDIYKVVKQLESVRCGRIRIAERK